MAEDDTAGLEALLELIEEALDREAAGADEDAAAGEDSSEDEAAEHAAAEAEEEGEAEEAEEDTWVTTWSGPGYTVTEKGELCLERKPIERTEAEWSNCGRSGWFRNRAAGIPEYSGRRAGQWNQLAAAGNRAL